MHIGTCAKISVCYSTQVNQIGFTSGGAVENLIPNVPVPFTVIVHDPHMKATKLTLTLHISYLNRNDPLFFKDIPIQ